MLPPLSLESILGRKVWLASKLLEEELMSFDQVTKLFCSYALTPISCHDPDNSTTNLAITSTKTLTLLVIALLNK